MHDYSKVLDQLIVELSQNEQEPEISACINVLIAAKRLLKTYSQRVLELPFKTIENSDNAFQITDLASMVTDISNTIALYKMWLESVVIESDEEEELIEDVDVRLNEALESISELLEEFVESNTEDEEEYEGVELLGMPVVVNDQLEYEILYDDDVRFVESSLAVGLRNLLAHKNRYEDFNSDESDPFGGASGRFADQREKRREEQDKEDERAIERQTDQKLRNQGIENCRDENGQFTDC